MTGMIADTYVPETGLGIMVSLVSSAITSEKRDLNISCFPAGFWGWESNNMYIISLGVPILM